jgi:cell division protein YceG involved in septum cleavage
VCRSTEFIAATTPIEGVFMKLQYELPKGDPRRDLLANSFEAYQQAAVAMTASERGKSERPDAIIVAAGLRKHLRTKILEGNMTPEEKKVYYAWRKATIR